MPSRHTPLRRLPFAMLAVTVLISADVVGATVYDAALGTLPAAQSWVTPVDGSQSVGGGSLTIDTTANEATQVSNLRADLPLDTSTGYVLDIRLNVVSESHSSGNRAGFSVINIGTDQQHALEIAFWEDEVWFYDAAFSRTNAIAFAPGQFHDFSFRFANNLVDVFIDGALQASGLPLYDYCSPANPCLPAIAFIYNLPNHFVFGDDTTSAAAEVMIQNIGFTPVPLPPALLLFATAAVFLHGRRARAAPGRAGVSGPRPV